MLYVIYAEDIADSLEKRLSVRPAYIAAGVYRQVSVKPYKKVF